MRGMSRPLLNSFPKARREQREHSDRQQDAGEGEGLGKSETGAIEVVFSPHLLPPWFKTRPRDGIGARI